MNKTKIDWCDSTINPVMGCPNGCKYCYARKLNTRFKWIEDWCKPHFFPERLKEFESGKREWTESGKKSKSIFIDSMSDIGTWKQEWFNAVAKAINDNPQHNYIALTKRLDRFLDIMNRADVGFVHNLYFGTSITTQEQADKIDEIPDFFSIEPILEPIKIPDNKFPVILIIGAETGNRKGKVVPQKEWIDSIVEQADTHCCTVFMKESLRKIMGKDFRQDKLPWEIK